MNCATCIPFKFKAWRCVVAATLGTASLGQVCVPDADPGDGGDFVGVSIQNLAFSPKEVTIEAGQTVRWTNRDLVAHTVTSGDPGDQDSGVLFDSGTMTFARTFTHQFNEPGEFTYYCIPHQTMASMRDAKVIVTAAAP